MTKRNPIGIDQLLPEIDYGEYVFSKKEITYLIMRIVYCNGKLDFL